MQLSRPPRPGLARGLGLVLACVVLLGLQTTTAVADDPFNRVTCQDAPSNPGCDVHAGRGASPAGSPVVAHRSGPRATTAKRSAPCADGGGVGCADADTDSAATDNCTYTPASPSAQEQAALGGSHSGPGGWYEFNCPVSIGVVTGVRWVAGAPPAQAAAPSPEVLARQAVSRLKLPPLSLSMSPAGTQLVTVPTWLWIDPAFWRPRSATAQVPGVVVTATASPSRVVWSTGDGTTLTCTGPGTAWTPGTDPATPSPTCGHTYRRSSAGMPGGTFPVTATVSWDVVWAGGGQGGTVPGLSTTSTAAVRVAEVQAVVAG